MRQMKLLQAHRLQAAQGCGTCDGHAGHRCSEEGRPAAGPPGPCPLPRCSLAGNGLSAPALAPHGHRTAAAAPATTPSHSEAHTLRGWGRLPLLASGGRRGPSREQAHRQCPHPPCLRGGRDKKQRRTLGRTETGRCTDPTHRTPLELTAELPHHSCTRFWHSLGATRDISHQRPCLLGDRLRCSRPSTRLQWA